MGEPGTSCKGREPCRAPPAHRAQHACLDTEPRGTRRPTSDLDSALGFPSRRSGQCTWALRECDVRGGERARAQTVPGAVPCKMPALNFVCGFDLQEPSAQPRSRCAADILDLLYDVEGLNMCASLPQHHAQATRAGSERAHAILSRSVSILLRRGCKRAHLLPRTLTSLPHPQLPERERKGSVRAGWQRLARYLAAAGG